MKLKLFFVLILICLLTQQALSQRGGGSRGSSGRSRSSSRSSRMFSRKTSNTSDIKQPTYQDYLILTGFLGVLGYFAYQAKNKLKQKKQQRELTIQRIINDYQKNNQQNVCTLEEDQRNKKIDWFMTNKWTVQYNSGTNNNGRFSIRVTDIVKKNDYTYEIKATGENDQLGNSDLRGILMFQKNYLSICVDKVYDNRQKAGQTGKWSVLIYEGIQNGLEFNGKWYYEGFENNSEYSGQMKMVHD